MRIFHYYFWYMPKFYYGNPYTKFCAIFMDYGVGFLHCKWLDVTVK